MHVTVRRLLHMVDFILITWHN